MTPNYKGTVEQVFGLVRAINYIQKYYTPSEYFIFLELHEEGYEWTEELKALNVLSIDQLRELIGQPQPSLAAQEIDEQQTNLSPVDHMSMIDIALMTGDIEWFNELVTKVNEGAIS